MIDGHLESVMLPPRPIDFGEDDGLSFLDDEEFADKKGRNWKFTLQQLKRRAPILVVVVVLVGCAFLAGYWASRRSLSGSPASQKGGTDGTLSAPQSPPPPAHDDHPFCGISYSIPGGTGYGGHNVASGCVNTGRMSLAACIATLEKRGACTAATHKVSR